MEKKFKYFTTGYPEYLVLPMFGLYQPVLDCFVFVLDSLSIARQIQQVCSSRYNLHIVCLNTAKNYKHNLIDNVVCHTWTVTDAVDLIRLNDLNAFRQVNLADELTQKNSKINWDIDKEKNWLFLCHHYLSYLHLVKTQLAMPDIVSSYISHKNPNRLDQYNMFENEVLHLLYFERDFDVADTALTELINASTICEKRPYFHV